MTFGSINLSNNKNLKLQRLSHSQIFSGVATSTFLHSKSDMSCPPFFFSKAAVSRRFQCFNRSIVAWDLLVPVPIAAQLSFGSRLQKEYRLPLVRGLAPAQLRSQTKLGITYNMYLSS